MIPLQQFSKSDSGEYCCRIDLDLYDSPSCEVLATQAAAGRRLQLLEANPLNHAIAVRLWEDGYTAWLPLDKLAELEPSAEPYQAIALSRTEIEQRIPAIIAFANAAMEQPNYYLWGGTVGPNYDCSGLIQAAFSASGIWLPRDSCQQAAFTQRIPVGELLPGDLIFFAKQNRVNHVALSLGEGYYIHSSGKEMGRNGIGIDQLSEQGYEVSRAYYRQLWGCGRLISSYQPVLETVVSS